MAKKKQPTSVVVQTLQPGQRSAPGGDIFNYLYRVVPPFGSPLWWEAQRWRTFVQNQPIAVTFRETLISYIQNLDWAIVPRDSEMQDELKDDIKYYTKLLENTSGYYSDFDFTTHIEFILKDLLDLPFGGASELGRENDDPAGKVVWIRPLDGGTLAPTLNKDWPVMQRVLEFKVAEPIFFPDYGISRIYLSPRTEIRREGWGMAPPEKIYLAMELLRRGDNYYADLLLNTPEVGILDLGDMEKQSAEDWIKSFQDLMTGINPFKIPVTYEHTSETKWIPFGKLPNDIMFDSITRKYAAIVGAGYGMTLSDIGLSSSSSNGGNTLAGTIREERHTNNSGKSTVKKKLIAYFNKILPPDLMFKWIDYDAEQQVATGRARLANSQSAEIQIRNQVFSPDEMRMQAIRDGLITISVPEKLDRKGVEWPSSGASLGSGMLGKPAAPSSGGHGEVLSTDKTVIRADLAKAIGKVYSPVRILVKKAKTSLNPSELADWSQSINKTVFLDGNEAKLVIDNAKKTLSTAFSGQKSAKTTLKNYDLASISAYILDSLVADREAKAKEDFILEKRSDSVLSEDEYLQIENQARKIDPEKFLNDTVSTVDQILIDLTTKSAISMLKDELLEKLPLDTENGIGDNKLEVVNTVADKLYVTYDELEKLALEAGESQMKNKIRMEAENVTGN